MPNYRQDFEDRNLGQRTRINNQAQADAEVIANKRIEDMVRAKEAENMRISRDRQFIDSARAQGQMEGAEAVAGGLGMGSQTVEGMNQLNQVSQESLMADASQYVSQALQALQQGMDPREVDAQISQGVEPELQDTVRQMLGQEMQKMQAQSQGNQQQQAPQSTASASSEAIMREIGQMGNANQ